MAQLVKIGTGSTQKTQQDAIAGQQESRLRAGVNVGKVTSSRPGPGCTKQGLNLNINRPLASNFYDKRCIDGPR